MTSRPEAVDPGRLHAIMAGNGYPYRVLTDERKLLLRALHDGATTADPAELSGLPRDDAQLDLAALAEVSLVQRKGESFRPTFVIADEAEVRRVCEHAEAVGRRLGAELLGQWSELQDLYEQLAISESRGFRSMTLLFVGDMILDIGLLNALARDGSLMPAAPARPDPEHPDARYYFWMIEGEFDQLGRYGQRGMGLPWPDWELVSFGQYRINGILNEHRGNHDREALAMAADGRAASPEQLADLLKAPLIEGTDSGRWMKKTRMHTDRLVSVYREGESSIRDLYVTLRASEYAPHGFGEFFCWYDHVAYAAAIDFLVESDVMTIPAERYISAVRQSAGDGEFGV